MKTKATIIFSLLAIFLLSVMISCEDDNKLETGTLSLSITDAPIDDTTITGVFITIDSLQYHMQDNEWKTFEEYDGPKTINLLELTNGASELLGNFEMEAGQYTQLRFLLDAPANGQGQPTNPGCYMEYENGETVDLFVPSGGQSGYKAVGAFTVPSNGTVDITADFDVRKSVVEAGATGRYILKPTIRLIVDNQAGSITGGISNIPEGMNISVFAYEDGTYSDTEAAEPGDQENRFPNAVSSDIVEENNYTLSYLAPMKYDLVVVGYMNNEFYEVMGIVEDVAVESNNTTSEPIDLTSL
jgi:hypothetical protein